LWSNTRFVGSGINSSIDAGIQASDCVVAGTWDTFILNNSRNNSISIIGTLSLNDKYHFGNIVSCTTFSIQTTGLEIIGGSYSYTTFGSGYFHKPFKMLNVKLSNSLTLDSSGNYGQNTDYSVFDNCEIGVLGDDKLLTINSNNTGVLLNNCRIFGRVNINGKLCKISNCYIGTTTAGSKTITISSTADKTTLIGNTTEAIILDGGTNTQMLVNNIF
jgi:hypothetical protein